MTNLYHKRLLTLHFTFRGLKVDRALVRDFDVNYCTHDAYYRLGVNSTYRNSQLNEHIIRLTRNLKYFPS